MARYKELEQNERNPIVMEFSSGPKQVKPTQLMSMMEKEISQRVEKELKKHDEEK